MLLENTPAQHNSLLDGLKQAAIGIGLHLNSDKTEFISFNQDEVISSLNGKTLKLVDQFIYIGSIILSIRGDVYIHKG